MESFPYSTYATAKETNISPPRTGSGNIFTRRYKKPKETNYRQIEKQILDDVLGPKVYDARIRPAGENSTGERKSKLLIIMTFSILDGPSMVYVNIFVRSFSKIDDVKMVS